MPSCATPAHLLAFLEERNKQLPAKFREIAADYKKHGEELHVRWDYAFYQMLVETNYLKFVAGGGKRGDVSPGQNNFAGLGATGHRAPGESFPDVDTGVLAHLQHVRLYSGEPVENPVAERTRLVTDLILPWAQSLKHPVTFTDLTHKWAPNGHSYSDAIEGVADLFRQGYCSGGAEAEQSADASDADAAAAPKTMAKPAAKVGAKVAAVVIPKMRAPSAAATQAAVEPAATDTGNSDEAAATAPDLAGPALKKPARVAVVTPDTATDDQSDATEGATTAEADGAPATTKTPAVKHPVVVATAEPATADSDAEAATETAVSPAAGKVVSLAKKAGSKLPVAATVTAPAAPAAGSEQDVAAADESGDGDGGATEVTPPAAKAPAVKTPATKAAAVKIVPKGTVLASAAVVPAVMVKVKAQPAVVQPADTAVATTETTTEDATSNTQLASMTVPSHIEPAKNCKVFTASYGGGKSLLIRSLEGDHTRFTALTVNEAKADTQAKAFINVYAKGGEKIGEYGTQNEALTKAFELCPES